MKKSEVYKLAQLSVLYDDSLNADEKLAVLGQLIDDERLAKFSEKSEDGQV